MNATDFREALLSIMEKKTHWAWDFFASGKVAKDKLHIHLEQEYATYVRDFPIMVGWAYVQCPIATVRRALAENLYEEETGGISARRPHPELFLEYPRGLGMTMQRFEEVQLLPKARAYREFLDNAVQKNGWAVAAALTTLFIEGTSYERGEVDTTAPKRPQPPLEDHPLVKYYGLPLEKLALTKVHRAVEGSHRAAAWNSITQHVQQGDYPTVLKFMETCLQQWQGYRDDVAHACGLRKSI